MRIIERKLPVNGSIVYVVQDEGWSGASAYQNSLLGQGQVYGKRYQDIKSFGTLEEAKAFSFQYVNNLQPGERIVG
jgi:hypothetical protein